MAQNELPGDGDRATDEGLDSDRLSSVELVRRAQSGDPEALDRLLERYLPLLRRWATGRLPGWARALVDTDDMIQDTLIKTVRNIASFVPQHDGALAAYFRQALDNRIRDEVRNASRLPPAEEIHDSQPDAAASPLEVTIGHEALQRYEEALRRIPTGDRELIVARIEMGASYEEVARATNRPSPDAARMAVRRALLRLATEMSRD